MRDIYSRLHKKFELIRLLQFGSCGQTKLLTACTSSKSRWRFFCFSKSSPRKQPCGICCFFPLPLISCSDKKTFTRLACNEFDFPNRKQLAAFPLRCNREQEVQLTRSNRKSFTWHCCNDLNVLEGNELATHRECKRSSCMNVLRHVAFLSQMFNWKNSKFFSDKHISV